MFFLLHFFGSPAGLRDHNDLFTICRAVALLLGDEMFVRCLGGLSDLLLGFGVLHGRGLSFSPAQYLQ